MTRTEASAELAGIARLFRDHAYLRYSDGGSDEYEDKLRSAAGLFAVIVRNATGMAVPNPYPAVRLDGLIVEGGDSAPRTAKRVASRLAAAAASAGSGSAARLAEAADAWRRAAVALAALPR